MAAMGAIGEMERRNWCFVHAISSSGVRGDFKAGEVQ